MSRWHEPSCRRPDITAESGIPFCNYCFALASFDDTKSENSLHIIPLIRAGDQTDLSWPSAVNYKHASLSSPDGPKLAEPRSKEKSRVGLSKENSNSELSSQVGPSVFPEIESQEIRLLRLSADQLISPIHVEFEKACLNPPLKPEYDAISYTWADESGQLEKCSRIFVGPYWDIIYVTQNCEDALRSVRHKHKDRLVWIDSLCIRHDNPDEKTLQVGLMRDIYMNASQVVAYLGKASKDSKEALGFLRSAAAEVSISGRVATIDAESRSALQSLFQRPYFCRVWTLVEVVLAKDLQIICGSDSVLWPKWISKPDFPGIQAPPWLFDRDSWHGFASQDFKRLLLDSALYGCLDSRDKVFGVVTLMFEKELKPDYRLSVESVYIGTAAYLVKNCLELEILALAGNGKRALKLPSWVPDWSQKLVLQFPKVLSRSGSEDDVDGVDLEIELSIPLVFDRRFSDVSTSKIQVEAHSGSLQVTGVKLCQISGEVARCKGHDHILMAKGKRSTLVVSLIEQNYTIATDFLFLLNGWNRPVILRYHEDKEVYSFVSVCVLSLGPNSTHSRVVDPWTLASVDPAGGEIKVMRFTPQERDLIQTYYSELMTTCGLPAPPVLGAEPSLINAARFRVLDFHLLLLSGYHRSESELRSTWNKLDKKLAWMFLDQTALSRFEGTLNELSEEQRSGEGALQFWEYENRYNHFYDVDPPSNYEWNLERFVRSFSRLSAPVAETPSHAWTPVLAQMQSHIPEIIEWAKVTEQLLKGFEYTSKALEKSWDRFPGSQLPFNWSDGWQNSRKSSGQDNEEHTERPQNVTRLWVWSEFKDVLEMREQLWRVWPPNEFNPRFHNNMAAHLELRSKGLDLERELDIKIV